MFTLFSLSSSILSSRALEYKFQISTFYSCLKRWTFQLSVFSVASTPKLHFQRGNLNRTLRFPDNFIITTITYQFVTVHINGPSYCVVQSNSDTAMFGVAFWWDWHKNSGTTQQGIRRYHKQSFPQKLSFYKYNKLAHWDQRPLNLLHHCLKILISYLKWGEKVV